MSLKPKSDPSLYFLLLIFLTIFIIFIYGNSPLLTNYYSKYSLKFDKNETLSRLRNLYKFIYNVEKKNSSEEEAKPFVILFWTTFYGRTFTSKDNCPGEKGIVLTSNKADYDKADAILFEFVDMNSMETVVFPEKRDPNVPWIMSLQEAPIHHPYYFGNGSRYDGRFNWTWSTRSDSLFNNDFPRLYKFNEKFDENWIFGSAFSSQFLGNKTKLGAWVVSNCFVQKSDRNILVKSLQDGGLSIDIFGNCGNLTCERNENCFEELGTSHKFYFALENALCEGYITEKINHGLHHGMIPVVYAMGDVQKYAPPNSFINVLDFNSTDELIQRIKYLDKNPNEYFKYFEWRQIYNLSESDCFPWRSVKEYTLKIRNGEEKYRHNYEIFDDWYNYFENKRFGKKCYNCLFLSQVDIKHPVKNRMKMYNDISRCKE